MATTIANLAVNLTANTARFSRGMLKAQTEMGFTIRNAGRLEEKIGKVGLTVGVMARAFHVASGLARAVAIAMAAATAAAVGLAAAAGKVASAFDDQLAKVSSVTMATRKQLQGLAKDTMKVGMNFGISPTEMMKGQVEAARTGLDTEDIRAIQEDIARLAKIEMVDFSRAAELSTNVLKAFRLEGDALAQGPGIGTYTDQLKRNFNDVADTIAATSAITNTNMTRLSEGLKKMASNANVAGVSLQQASAAMGMLGDVGLVGEEAGTALRNIITRTYVDTRKMKQIVKETKLSLTDSKGNAKDLVGILQEIERIDLGAKNINEIFGLRAGPALIALLQQGSEKLQKMTEFLDWAKDNEAAMEMFKRQQDTVSVALGRVKAALETVAILVGQVVNVYVKEAAEKFMTWFMSIENLDGKLKDLTVGGVRFFLGGLANMLDSLRAVTIPVGILIDALRGLGKTFKILAKIGVVAIKAITTPIRALISGMEAFYKGIISKVSNLMRILDSDEMNILQKAKAIDDTIKNIFSGGITGASGFADAIKKSFSDSLDSMGTDLDSIGEDIKKLFNREEALKYSNMLEEVAKGGENASAHIRQFITDAEKRLANTDMLDGEFAKKWRQWVAELKRLQGTWDGSNVVDTTDAPDEKKLEFLNRWLILADQIAAKHDPNQRRWKAQMEYWGKIEDINRRKLKDADKEFLLMKAKEELVQKFKAIENERAATQANRAEDLNDEVRAIGKALALARELAITLGKETFSEGAGMFGGAGVGSSLSAEMQEMQAAYDQNQLRMTAERAKANEAAAKWQEYENSLITEKNQLIIKQIQLYEQLADVTGQELPKLANELSTIAEKTLDSEEGAKAMLGAMQSVAALGGALISTMAKDQRAARTQQAALNLTMAAFAAGMGGLALGFGWPGAAGFFAAAAAFGAKGALGLLGNKKANQLSPTGGSAGDEETDEAAESTKRGVVEALKEAGLYQVGWTLTVNEFGSTPIGGFGGRARARATEDDRQDSRRRRG